MIENDWTPTPQNINALPEPVRRYIHDLETNADPAGTVRDNCILRTENECLRLLLAEMVGSTPPG